MLCPQCGKPMQPGELTSTRGDTSLYWLPQAFVEKHWLNPYSHTRKTIEKEGGLRIKANNRLQQPSPCFACRECQLILVKCG